MTATWTETVAEMTAALYPERFVPEPCRDCGGSGRRVRTESQLRATSHSVSTSDLAVGVIFCVDDCPACHGLGVQR